ncbi:exo-alpha-sialidase [Proteiniclasticum sp. BAD-10]|uniref:exo-alpha-sialidase n=1 Tax=Proteiniclasticum sediminis TaxID=2804028 RepID=A0A941HQD9_9CLOT|nr:exo-alpha-sialidase [Proteiniclasticum sediminis]MBR0575052.1 exo-alpha-sialidase [Proteiniclasticum sediminis]
MRKSTSQTGPFLTLKNESFSGNRFLNLDEHLETFLQEEAVSLKAVFRTTSAEAMAIFSIFYKDSAGPDFAFTLYQGYPQITRKESPGSYQVLRLDEAINDGERHELLLNYDKGDWQMILDGEEKAGGSGLRRWCCFGYVGFACVGRSVQHSQFREYFEGELEELSFSTTPFLPQERDPLALKRIETQKVFFQGLSGVENYRIPSILYAQGQLLASCDARMEVPGDNPNHIVRALRRSFDEGVTWEEPEFFLDYGGYGRSSGAAAIDGSLLYEEETQTLWLLYTHSGAKVGAFNAEPGTGFTPTGEMILRDSEGKRFLLLTNQRVVEEETGRVTDMTVDALGRIFQEGKLVGTLGSGEGPLYQHPTTYLMAVKSPDLGKTWSNPIHLNPMVKDESMSFLGAGPGVGLCLKKEPYAGRLVFPVYALDPEKKQRARVIYSDDQGKTWRISEGIESGEVELTECQLLEMEDGTLRLYARNTSPLKEILTVESHDGGVTFQHLQSVGVKNPYCQISVTACGGKYYLSTPSHSTYRLQGTLYESLDGLHWTPVQLLEPGEFGYSCLVAKKYGNLGLLYEGRSVNVYYQDIQRKNMVRPVENP